MPFGASQDVGRIPFTLFDYLELAGYSGRLLHPKKRCSISGKELKILEVINIEQDTWFSPIQYFRSQYGSFAGSRASLLKFAVEHDDKWYKGVD